MYSFFVLLFLLLFNNKLQGGKLVLEPKLFSILRNRSTELGKKQLMNDVISGIIVAIVALPLSIALAIASGVSPEKGLITAIVGGFIIAFFGGSRVQIGGPTGAFVIIVYGIIQNYGLEGLTIATILAGCLLVLFGLLRFGSIIKYIPYPITTGFTAGIAIVLFSTQVKDFLGLKIDQVPSEFFEKWGSYISNLSTITIQTCIIGVIALLIIIFLPKISKTIPATLVALVVTTILVQIFHLPVETIGSRFGEISSTLPMPKLVNFNLKTIGELMHPAITIAILAGIESLLSAVVADGMIGKKHNSNMELVAQGMANIACGLFGSIPATGAIARTATNIKSGGRTPIAGIVHSVVLLLIMLILMPYAKLIPMTTLAAILIVVSYNMSEWRAFKGLLYSTKSDISVLIISFLFTVIFDLVVAIEIGMVLAMFLSIKKIAESTQINKIFPMFEDLAEDGEDKEISPKNAPALLNSKQILVYEINGPLFFGAANTFMDVMNEVKSSADILILRMENVPIIDATAFDVLKRIDIRCRKHHIMLLMTELQQQPLKLLIKTGFVERLGSDRFFDKLDDALAVANSIVKLKNKTLPLRKSKRHLSESAAGSNQK